MGRPRRIPESEAVQRALLVFWRLGYDRASVADLSAALELGPSSLYNAFGSKEDLFRRAIARYVQSYASFVGRAAETTLDVEPAVRSLMREAARVYTAPETPPGCAVMQSAGAASAEQSVAARVTCEAKAMFERQIKAMLERGAKGHAAPLPAPAAVLARYLVCTLRGLSQQAVDGVPRRDLLRVADVAARACVQ